MKIIFAGLAALVTTSAFAVTPVTYQAPQQLPMPKVPAMPSHTAPNPQALMGHHAAAAEQQVETILVHPGTQNITVNLKANATTGYMWFLTRYDDDALTLEGYHYQAPNTRRVGAGGVAHFHFAIEPGFFTAPQVTTLHFVYAQAWHFNGQGETKVVRIVSVGGGQATKSAPAQHSDLTTKATVTQPYTVPLQTTNASPSATTGHFQSPANTMHQVHSVPSTQLPKMQGSNAPQHSAKHHSDNSWLSLPQGHQQGQ